VAGGVEPKVEIASDDNMSEMHKIPVMIFPIKRRINTELYNGDKERINKISDLLEEGKTETAGK